MSANTISLLRGAEADVAIHDAEFIRKWQMLFLRCPYATAFQRPEFVCPWYSTYRREWEPVVLLALDALGDFTGLWLLAWNKETQALVHAGAHQAEYHTWLVSSGYEKPFLQGAWKELRRTLSFARLRFDYLPNMALAALLKTTLSTVTIRGHRRPLLNLDPARIRASFAKKSNKSRFNRLCRMGSVEFKRVSDPKELERVFDELIDFYDIRQGAMHSVMPFRRDRLKRDFHTALFASAPESVVLTVTYLAGRPIAAYWGLVSNGQSHLGMLIHSPFLAEHSPGKLHLMQLSEYLIENGVSLVDLTPGGDAWKERFANGHDEVASAVLYASRWNWWSASTRMTAFRAVKGILRIVGSTPKDAKSALPEMRQFISRGFLSKWQKWVWESRECRVYRADRAIALQHVKDPRVRCNHLSDLMVVRGDDRGRAQDGFLSTALTRLERGESVWTIRLNECLAHTSWTIRRSEVNMVEVDQTLSLPVDSLLMYEFHSEENFGGRGLFRAAVGHMLRVAFDDESLRYAYICVMADNVSSRHEIETLGFSYQGSFHWRRRIGRVMKSRDAELDKPEAGIGDTLRTPS